MNTPLSDTLPAFSILGPPGCGKGTQAALLQERLNYFHVSTGEVLRAAIKNGDPAALKVQDLIAKGLLAPDSLIFEMLENELSNMLQNMERPRGVILDGFPRSIAQAEMVDTLAKDLEMRFMGMVNLEVPEELLVQRLLDRGKSGEQRPDDNEEVIQHRMVVYHEKTFPLVKFFTERNQLINVNGVGSVDDIYGRLVPVIEKMEQESLLIK